ncbi:tRNA (adenosine(37)-N6)-threonylcarbamoyltransferase complex dimerization subunit type 1 TsaB [Lampropedia aestuarii]|uniref:tRNA (Adenosine(37)-N6)-threonylcarbamoyltransferase complex dimerization subunit type 1 TsaB n=1 Tax=Lampropedia aestuarii TaxID=2562762 RepID=A0A4S5BNG2_9BURK|nr:tRNA (adenosine(37)-N6)-threonylcarbamoyltransferase complex dimerization subunit type 1 TsaB [Lampropedia aestuarii]THJ32435.1 tRNA (adenosine(37)-N6)-threonylcarbamoyltransferase complex dimerization subunit type 1 TsaB [Lampropedia aestuarii]
MRLLAFDTSTDVLSLAVQNHSVLLARELAGGPKSSRVLLPESLQLLQQLGLALQDLDAIVYGCGPGAFTGLRTSCAAAQGLAFGSHLSAVPVDSLLAIAEGARHAHGVEQVVAVLDARMQEVYAAPFRWLEAEQRWQREADIQVMKPQDVQVPDGYVLAGNAFAVYPEAFAEYRAERLLHQLPQAEAMLRLAPGLIAAQGLQAPSSIAPLYIRNKVAQTTEERMRARQALELAEKSPAALGD